MENRHLFRGKRIDNGEWAEGYLFVRRYDNGKPFEAHIIQDAYEQLDVRIGKGYYGSHPVLISPLTEREIDKGYGCYRVNLNTICQCTGLKDKNGKLIFENDIVKDLFSDTAAPIRYGRYQSCFDSTKVEHVGFYVDWSGKYNKNYRKDLGYWIHMVDAEIIGNAFDNPELLE